MLPVKAFVNGYEVISSGLLHVVGSSAQLVIDNMPIDISFKDDSGETRYTTEVEGHSLKLDLINFNNPLGEGRINPITVASAQGRDIKITFFVNTIDKLKAERSLAYTILMGPEANG